jgi:hypothetical protein
MSGKGKVKKGFQITQKNGAEKKQDAPVKNNVQPTKTKKDVQSKGKKGN